MINCQYEVEETFNKVYNIDERSIVKNICPKYGNIPYLPFSDVLHASLSASY